MATVLPDPQWTELAELCIRCGYCLRGLPVPGRCPECGAPFEARQLVLAGVPHNRARGRPFRTALWIAAVLAATVFSSVWAMLIFIWWALPLIILVVLVGYFVALLVTSPRERRGTERFVLSPGGVARMPAEATRAINLDAVFIPWEGCNSYELRRVSAVWYRLRIGQSAVVGGPIRDVIFDAGIRCNDEWAGIIGSTLRDYLNVA